MATPQQQTRRAIALSVILSVLLFTLTGWLAVTLQRGANARQASEVAIDATELQGRATQYLQRRVQLLRSMQAFFLTTDEVTPERFGLFAVTVGGGLTGLNGLLFFDTRLHAPWVAPTTPQSLRGLDLARRPEGALARQALRTGHRVVGDPVTMPDGEIGFWVFAPVARKGHVLGLVGTANGLDPLIAIFRDANNEVGDSFRLTDSRGQVFFANGPVPADALQKDIPVDDRIWHFEIFRHAGVMRFLPTLVVGLAGVLLWGSGLVLIWADLFSSARLSREVTARTADLQASRDQLRAILDGVDAGIVAIGPNGRVVYANQAGRAQLTSPDGRRSGMSMEGRFADFALRAADGHLLTPEERPSARALRGETIHGEVLMVEVAGAEPVQMLFKATPIRVENRIPLAIVISQNVTERVKLEQALRDQLKAREALDKMKSDFLSVVTHELRTPLTSIKGYAEFLEDGLAGDLNGQQMSYLNQVQTATQQLEALVDDLLDMARMEAGAFTLRRQRIDSAVIAQQAIDGFRPQAASQKIRLGIDAPEHLEMLADPVRLTQILNNLLSNALKFTPEGGEVTLRLCDTGPGVEFEVCDTGIGITPENLPRLFTKFFQAERAHTRAHKGTGLGLAITKGLVEMHGGQVSAESTLGQGTSIHVRLPKDGAQSV